MPKFLEEKLKKEYGAKSSVPYKVMNAIGAMHGNKETAKGAAMEKKHVADYLQTTHVPPHRGVTVHGEAHGGHVAGNMPAHKHDKVTHHYEK